MSAAYWVNPASGSDSNPGTSLSCPFATIGHACDVLNAGADTQITLNLANGTYVRDPSRTFIGNVVYDKVVTVIGNIASPNNVVLQLLGNDVGFEAQDNGIVACNGLYFVSSGANSNAIQGRQNAIADASCCWFGSLSIALSATEKSKLNLLPGCVVIGNQTYFASAVAESEVSLNAPMQIVNGVAYSAFVHLAQESFIDASSLVATVYGGSGPAIISGQKWINSHSEINGIANLPGSGFTNAGHFEVNT